MKVQSFFFSFSKSFSEKIGIDLVNLNKKKCIISLGIRNL